MSKNGLLFVVSGPSGVGKGTVIKEVLNQMPSLQLATSATTRTPRSNEINGDHYHFLTKAQFQIKIDNEEFLEYCEVHGNFYGTLISEVHNSLENGKDVIIEIDTQGAQKIKAVMDGAISIFLAPPTVKELKARLETRGTDSPESIASRIKIAKQELKEQDKYDYIIKNEILEKTIKNVLKIINNRRELEMTNEKDIKNIQDQDLVKEEEQKPLPEKYTMKKIYEIVPNRFMLTVACAKRSKQLAEGVEAMVDTSRFESYDYISIALQEIFEGKLHVVEETVDESLEEVKEMDQILDNELKDDNGDSKDKRDKNKPKSKSLAV